VTRPGASPPSRWEDYFEPGERLLWQGGPVADPRLRPGQIALAAFGLPFLGVGLFLFLTSAGKLLTRPSSLSEAGLALFLLLFSLPFVGAGLGMVFGPHLAARLAPRFVRYALSDRRAYIANRWWWRRDLASYPIAPDSVLELKQGRTDTVTFYSHAGVDSDGDKHRKTAAFESIADGPAVYALLRKVQRGDA
jgi:hypothetical protein